MDLQNTFYVLGIIYMVFGILILIAIAVVLFFIFKKVTHIINIVEEKVDEVKKLADHPAETAFAIGEKVAAVAMQKNKSRKRSHK